MKTTHRIYFHFCYLLVIMLTSCLPKASTKIVTNSTVTDIDGNVYQTVTIGTQTWMVENLKTTHFNDGTTIPLVTDNTAWANLSTPGYCWYDNNVVVFKNTYGALYNWFAVNTGKLAPVGWHVATDDEWTTLTDYVTSHLGTSPNVAKAIASTTNWADYDDETGTIGCNLSLNNSSGFSALPGGYRNENGFYGIAQSGFWWSATNDNTNFAWSRDMNYIDDEIDRVGFYKPAGFSVRCIKD